MNNYDDIKRFKEKLNMEGVDYKEIAENNPHYTPQNWAILKQIAAADQPFHPLEQGQTTQPVPVQVSNKEFIASDNDKPAVMQASQDIKKNDAQAMPATPFVSPLMAAVSKVLSTGQGADHAANETPAARSSSLIPSGHGQPASRPSIPDGLGGGLSVAGPSAEKATVVPKLAAGASIFDSIGRAAPVAVPATPLREGNVRPQPTAGASIFGDAVRPEPIAAPAQEMRFNKLFNRKSQLKTGVVPGRDMPLSLLLENIALCR